jgi:hypothetical protein
MPDDVRTVDLVARVAALEAAVARLQARQVGRHVPALLDALEAYFGPGRFTAGGVLELCDEDPHGAIGAALAELIDLSASPRSRATALGRLLARLPDVEVVAAVRGSAVYRLAEVREVRTSSR